MAPLGLGKSVAVLESKFQIYEDLSKEMLDKLERAVTTISENSNRISLVLERHEARLDQSDKADQAILKLIDKIEDKIDSVETRVNELSRFRWITFGVATAAVLIIKSADLFGSILSIPKPPLTTLLDSGRMVEEVRRS